MQFSIDLLDQLCAKSVLKNNYRLIVIWAGSCPDKGLKGYDRAGLIKIKMTVYTHGFTMMAHTGNRKNGSKIAEKMAHREIEKMDYTPDEKNGPQILMEIMVP